MTCSWGKARENECERVTIGFSSTSDWMKKWREFFKPIVLRSWCKTHLLNLFVRKFTNRRLKCYNRCLEFDSRVSLLNELSWVDLNVRRKLHKLNLVYKMGFKLAPPSQYVIYKCMSGFRFWHTLTDPFIVSDLLGIFAYLTFIVIGIKKSFLSSPGI